MAIGEGLVENAIVYAIRERLWRIGLLKCKLFQRNADIRVAFSALLRIDVGGRYLLVRNLHRKETFGPFGGIFKWLKEARPEMDSFGFHPDLIGPDNDIARDLRGFLPRKDLSRIIRWFEEGHNRETYSNCLCRELREELREIGLGTRIPVPRDVHFRHVRTVHEGPDKVSGHGYMQFRIFEVHEVVPQNPQSKRFLRQLLTASEGHPDLIVVTPDEIRRGRSSNGSMIGHHCGYLLWNHRIRPDTP